MKRIFSVFVSVLLLMLCVLPLSAFAAEEKTYEIFKYVVENGEVKIIGRTDDFPNIIKIPAEIDGYPVTTIGEEAFFDTIGALEIILPDTIVTIEKRAFNSCRGTEKINIPDGVKTIGDGAFGDCSEMLEGIIPDSVENFGEKVFKDCESLRSIKIPDHFTKIPAGTYDYCEDLYDIVIPDGITEIGESAFNECVDIVSINIPKSLTKIGEYAFYCCEELQDIYYAGTEADWEKIVVSNYNDSFKNARVHFESNLEEYVPAIPDETSSASPKKTEASANSDSTDNSQASEDAAEIIPKQNYKTLAIIISVAAVAVIAIIVVLAVFKKKKTKQ